MSDPNVPNDPSQSTDPYQEPPNSTVDDWHGQIVEDATEEADAALAEGSTDEEAERVYDQTIDSTKGAAEQDG